MPNFSAKCIDANGNDVPQGQVGELLVKGAPVIKGYLNREQATEESITNGWLHTGDVARIDEHGFIFIVDRVKDMVLRGGENIYCAEVEQAIERHPAVVECAAIGQPDDRLGERLIAIVTLLPGTDTSEADILTSCSAHLTKN
jgi:long-chain acyl-CoA synthetase